MEIDVSDELSELRRYLARLRPEEVVEYAVAEHRRRRRAEDHIRKVKGMTRNFWDWSEEDYPLGPEGPEGPQLAGWSGRLKVASRSS